MSILTRLLAPLIPTPGPDPRDRVRPLYTALVAEARRPDWYRAGGVADSVAGRFDMVCASLAAVLARLERSPDSAAEAVLLTETFVHDMDGQLRELGVGDIVVGKHIGKLMSAMGGRLGAYRAGLTGDPAALCDVVARNVTFRDNAGDPAQVAEGLAALFARLERTTDEQLMAGEIAA